MIKCQRCKRELTKQESIDRGYGSVCWRKVGGFGIQLSLFKGGNEKMLIEKYKGFGNCECECGLEIIAKQGETIVIITELPSNHGTSVTNFYGNLATLFYHKYIAGTSIKRIKWIEHYPAEARSEGETFDQVFLEWDGKKFAHPKWRRVEDPRKSKLTREEFDKLPSSGSLPCPDCGSHKTEPHPNCSCRAKYGYHVNKYHHYCKKAN